jgi:hypothetical protein
MHIIDVQSNVCPGKHPYQLPSLHITTFAQSTGKFQHPSGAVFGQKNGWSDAQHAPVVPTHTTTGVADSLQAGHVLLPQAGPQPHVPFEHGVPAGQAIPQPPQFASSPPLMTTHVPLQSVIWDGHGWQTPPAQSSIPQLLPHDPQFAGSVWTAVQLPPHTASSGSHAQVLLMQLFMFWQTARQLPQWFGSWDRSAQTPAQQTSPDGHAVPHPPQLFVSLPLMTVHVPAQPTAPAGQLRFS